MATAITGNNDSTIDGWNFTYDEPGCLMSCLRWEYRNHFYAKDRDPLGRFASVT